MGFLDWLTQFATDSGGIAATLNAIFAFLVFYINTLFLLLYKFLVAVGQFLYDILKGVAKFFQFVWDKFFNGILSKLFNAILKAHDWLEAHLRPIIDFLRKVRAFYDAFFKHYIAPFLNLLQHIRRFLLILRLLHIRFAATLDNYILQIETKVAGVFLQVRAALNGIIDVVNILADPTGLLRHPTMVIAIRRSIPAIVHSVTGRPISFFFPGKDVNSLTAPAAVDPAISFNFLSEYSVPDDSTIDDLLPLDYFVSTGAPAGDSDSSLQLLNVTLLETSEGSGPAIIDLGFEMEEVAQYFQLLIGARA